MIFELVITFLQGDSALEYIVAMFEGHVCPGNDLKTVGSRYYEVDNYIMLRNSFLKTTVYTLNGRYVVSCATITQDKII